MEKSYNRMKINIVTGCYNEEGNVIELINRVRKIMESHSSKYDYEHIFIDNASEDKTVDLLKSEANIDKNIKIIVNSRNFGHVRSPSYALLPAEGDAVISLVADLQDPPEMITDFLEKWESGNDIVIAVKAKTEETGCTSYSIAQLLMSYSPSFLWQRSTRPTFPAVIFQ